MKTEDLINQLGREMSPVRRLLAPWKRAALWLACSVVYVAAVVTFAWVRRGALGVESNAPYLLQQAALALAGILAALAAFASVIPGTSSRARAALAVPIGLMMAALLWGTMRDLQEFGTVGLGRETDWPCVVSITLGGLALWTVASAMLRRGAVLEPRLTAVLAGVAAVSVANIEACVSRVHAFTATVIVWHGVTIALVMVGLVALGPRLLSRRRPAPAESLRART
jgi:hypothetical protein